MIYKKMMLLLCLITSLHAMHFDKGQMPPIEDEKETHLNQSANELWDLLARFTQGGGMPTQAEFNECGKRYDQAYQEYIARHQQVS